MKYIILVIILTLLLFGGAIWFQRPTTPEESTVPPADIPVFTGAQQTSVEQPAAPIGELESASDDVLQEPITEEDRAALESMFPYSTKYSTPAPVRAVFDFYIQHLPVQGWELSEDLSCCETDPHIWSGDFSLIAAQKDGRQLLIPIRRDGEKTEFDIGEILSY